MHLEPTNVDGMINVSFVVGGNNISHMRCDVCGKFIKKDWEKFYCPHCNISFLNYITTKELKDAEEILQLIDWMV